MAGTNLPTVRHLIEALLTLNEGAAVNVLRRVGVDFVALRETASRNTAEPNLDEMLPTAYQEQRNLGHRFFGTEHLLLAIAQSPGHVGQFFQQHGLDIGLLREEVLRELDPNFSAGGSADSSNLGA